MFYIVIANQDANTQT